MQRVPGESVVLGVVWRSDSGTKSHPNLNVRGQGYFHREAAFIQLDGHIGLVLKPPIAVDKGREGVCGQNAQGS